MISRIATAALGAGLLLALGGIEPVQAQDQRLDQLMSRLDRLERDIGALSRQVYRGGTPPAGPAAGGQSNVAPPSGNAYDILDSHLSQLENSLTSLTGSIETLNHQNS